MRPIMTCSSGESDVIFADIARLYIKDGADVRDVTFGKGVFWKQIDLNRFKSFVHSDAEQDFRHLPDGDKSVDVFVIDPPYLPAHKGPNADIGTVKASIADQYRINETAPQSLAAITALYMQGMATRKGDDDRQVPRPDRKPSTFLDAH